MTVTVRMISKQERFELLTSLVVSLALIAAFVTLIVQLQDFGIPQDCFKALSGQDSSVICDSASLANYTATAEGSAGQVLGLMGVFPFALGALLGTPIVAAELERRTSVIAWSLTPSRPRWLVERIAILGLTVAVLSIGPAILADTLSWLRRPGLDAGVGFDAYGQRGAIVVLRAILAFALGVLVGTVMGRVVPALIVTAALSALIALGSMVMLPSWMPQVALPQDQFGNVPSGSLILDNRYRSTDGTELSWQEIRDRSPFPVDSQSFWAWQEDEFEIVPAGYPAAAYREVELRESLALGLMAIGSIMAAAVVVDRRRP